MAQSNDWVAVVRFKYGELSDFRGSKAACFDYVEEAKEAVDFVDGYVAKLHSSFCKGAVVKA